MDGPFKRSEAQPTQAIRGPADSSDQGPGRLKRSWARPTQAIRGTADPSDQGAGPLTYWSNTLKFPGVQKPDLVTSPVSMVAGTAWG